MGKTGHIYLISDHTILFYFTQSVVTYQLVWKPMIRPLFVRESSPKIVAMEKCQEHREETSYAVGSLIFLARELREQRAVDLSSRTSVAIQADFCVFHGVAKSMLVGRDLWGHSDAVLQKSLVAAFRSNSYLDLFKYMIPQIILKERPRVISSAVGHAWDLPANTFGAAYAKFMGSRNFSPDDRPPVRFMETEELAYVATRAREIHDFWHVLFNLPTNMLGESALKVVEFQQMYLPMCLLSVVGGSMRLKEKKREHFFKYYFPWAVRAGMSCTDIMSVYYEKYFDEDLEVVRHKWGILPAPDLQSIGTSLKS